MVSLRIALRYLFSKKSHNAVNIISIISVAGVAVATMAIVCVLSVFNGFADLAYSRLSKMTPQLMVSPRQGKTIAAADSLAATIQAIDGVDLAIPTISDQVLVIYNGRQMPVTIKGVTPDYGKITGLPEMMVDGKFVLTDDDADYASVSIGVWSRTGATPKAEYWLAIYAPRRKGRINTANPMSSFRSDSLLVSSVFQVNEQNFDEETIVTSIDVARRLLDYTTEASNIEISLLPTTDETHFIDQFNRRFGDTLQIQNRLQQGTESMRMIEIEKWITFLMLAFILIIASFNVISTLSMVIIEKRDNMHTLLCLGAQPSMISKIFLWEGWLISLLGGAIGLVMGIALSLAQQFGKFIRLAGDPAQLSITAYPVRLELSDLLIVTLLVCAVGYIIGLIASRLSRRPSP